MEKVYQVMYKVGLNLSVNGECYKINPADIVSISIINNYDTMTYPIIRIRINTDLELIQNVMEYPDEIEMLGNLNGAIYNVNTEEQAGPQMVSGATSINFNMKVYVENKNMPTSKMDQYRDGKKITSDLNQTPKFPLEMYGYHSSMIYYMNRKTDAIYKNMSLESIIEQMLSRGNIQNYYIDPLNQQSRFDQVIIPNLNMMQSFAFFDTYYGLYNKGAQIYGDIDQLYIVNTDSNIANNIIPIRIDKAGSNSNMVGLHKYDNDTYEMHILFDNMTVTSESDIERLLQSENLGAVNVNTGEIQSASLSELYQYKNNGILGQDQTPNLLHKHLNPFIAESNAARVKEKITKIDISGVGFDIGQMKINTRYNLIFNSAIRGDNIRGLYRPMFMNHVIVNQTNELFVGQTTMRLCKN